MTVAPATFVILHDIDGPQLLRELAMIGRPAGLPAHGLNPSEVVRDLIEQHDTKFLRNKSVRAHVTCDAVTAQDLMAVNLPLVAALCPPPAGELTFIVLPWLRRGTRQWSDWLRIMRATAKRHETLLARGWSHADAEVILPHSIKRMVSLNATLLEWRNLFQLLCPAGTAVRLQTRELASRMLAEFKRLIPVVFDDLSYPAPQWPRQRPRAATEGAAETKPTLWRWREQA